MARRLMHRGPDDEGVWVDADAGVALGFRRLAILDLSAAGHQPMRSPSGRFVGVFNGEVYNHGELRSALAGQGLRFRGHSDSEVILAAVETWGLDAAVERFIGMFAIVLWDSVDRRLTLIRDRLGIKPLYVAATGDGVAFASELKAIAAAPGVTRRLDRGAAADYLRYLYVPAPRSLYEGVAKLPPGHILEITEPGAPLPPPRPFWSVRAAAAAGRASPFAGSAVEAVEELDRLLRDAVSLRMIADVPVGALLSGGVDSTAVVALMQAQSRGAVRTYTVGFDDVASYDEAGQAARVARAIGTEHTELRMGGADALALVPQMADTFDEPIADPSILPTYLISRLARRDVTVALTGDGGDEVFAGYNRYVYGVPVIRTLNLVPRGLRMAAAAACSFLGSEAAPLRSARGRLAKVARLLAAPSAAEMYDSLHAAWLGPVPILGTAAEPQLFASALAAEAPVDLLTRMQLADQEVYLPDDLLAKVDRATMAVSLEARVPLLDHRVVEFAWRLPRRFKVRGRRGKWLLRQVAYRYVAPELVERPKMGFTVPVESWLRGPLREWAGDLLQASTLVGDGLIDGRAVRAAWTEFERGRRHSALAIWALAILADWWAHRPD